MSLAPLQKHWRPVAAVAAGLAVLVGGIVFLQRDDGGEDRASPGGTPGVGSQGAASTGGLGMGDLLRIRLSEGQAFPATPSEIAVVEGTVLSDEEVEAVLARLPELESDPDDRQEFNRPADSLRPPLVGDTVETAFPPSLPTNDDRPDATSGPLEVVRFQPEGEVAVAPFLSVTFNQPMVELTTLDQLREADIPVVVEPDVEGRWRWIGARTLRFELEPGSIDRLPAATEYVVTIPAGTRSASGAELAEAVTFSFATPAPRVAQMIGLSDATPVQPVLVAVFDQRVDPEAVLDSVTLTAGDDAVALELATDEQVEGDEQAARAVDAALDGRWVAFRPADPLPAATSLELASGPGTPSAEGPRTSTEVSAYQGRTFDALEVTGQDCNYGGPCQPGTPFTVDFNNPIDPERFDPASVTAEPAIGGMRVGVSGSQMTITGATRGRTDYTITLPADLTDVFGQTLGRDTERTFEVGPAQTQLVPFNRPFVTVDPMADQPGISVTSVNHNSVRVTAWRVDPDELSAFQRYQESYYSDTDPADPGWPEVLDIEIDIDGSENNAEDTAVETLVDLTDAFAESSDGQLVVRVAPTRDFDRDSEDYWYNRPTVAWVQSTTLGIDAILDGDEILIWTTDLTTGQVRPGVDVELVGSDRSVTTDDDGVARSPIQGRVRGLLGRDATAGGRDAVGFLPSSWYVGWEVQRNVDEARWYVFDDRGIYKPGETVRVTGWIRKLALSGDAQLELYGDADISWTAYDPVGNPVSDGRVDVNPLGGFNLTVELPDSANLGVGFIELQATGTGVGQGGASWSHQFQIQDFRTPEFEVTARPESPAPYYVVEPATVAVDANYYAGGPLPDADVNWLVTSAQTTYRPPRWDQFNFGIWQPWWYGGGFGPVYEDAAYSRGFAEDVAFGDDISCFGPDCPGAPTVEQFAGRTDGNGHHYLRLDFEGPDVDLPTTVTAEAQVTDVNRQVWASRTDLVVHPARYYVGLRADRPFVQQGTPIRVDTVVTDVDGAAVPDAAVEVTAGRVDQVWANGEANGPWTEEVVDTQTCTLTSVALDPATANSPDADAARPEAMRCEFETELGGQYRLTAVVTDGEGRRNRSEMTVWVTGADAAPNRLVTQETVTMVPDADSYAPGDTAQLLVQAPFAPASGLVTVSRGGIVSTQTFDAPDGSAVIDIGIEEAWIPNVTVQVDMVGTAVRLADDGTPQPDVPPRPAFATGQLNLPIPPVTRALDVVAEAADPLLDPGAGTSVTVSVTDAGGRPVDGADVAVIVVDEAVLSLTGYQLTDPLDIFYSDVWSQIFAEYTRSGIVLNRSDLVTGNRDDTTTADGGEDIATEEAAADSAGSAQATTTTMAAEPADGDGAANRSAPSDPPIAVRTDFSALALYAPSESTGPDGTVTLPVDLPDNLTRYRIMAVAIDGADQFGKGEGTITARLPIMVRPSAPRFLNFGDRFELPVVVQNQTELPMDVDVVVEGSNLTLTEGAGRRVTVPANDRLEVRFPAAAEEAGTARFRVAGVGAVADAVAGSEADANDTADAALVELSVYTPATAEAFATYGVIDDAPGARGVAAVGQPITAPEGVFPQFGGLEITMSSTAVQALTDAVLYLHDYRYDSAEGYASRIMAVSSLRDVLDAFDAEGLPDPAMLNAQVQRDIDRLAALQNDDGGFPYWQRGQRSIPWTTILATHALILADEAGYRIPADTLSRAKERLAVIEALYPSDYGPEMRASLSAYALNVRHQAGDSDASKALDVYGERVDVLQPDGLAWLWPVLTDTSVRAEIERELTNRAVDTAGAATFANAYTEDDWVIAASDRRTDGIVLDALISEAPDSDLIPKVVAGLLGSQVRGRWNNVLENGFILVAMKHYFDTFEGVTPDFVARAWLGDDYLSASTFEGRTTDRAFTLVPMDEVIAGGDQQFVVAKDGPGRLYYRLGLRYAPDDLVLDARDEGFVVDRIYEGTEAGDVTQDPDGTWRIRAGATVRVTLTMVADAARTHVALIDPLPAGLEPLNPALAVSATQPPPPSEEEGDEGVEVGAVSSGDAVASLPVDWCWCRQWYEHQNLRDDRAEAFTSYLPGGTYSYTYTARATTPGEFVVPPSRAEEMYAPETFGRSSSARVVIEE